MSVCFQRLHCHHHHLVIIMMWWPIVLWTFMFMDGEAAMGGTCSEEETIQYIEKVNRFDNFFHARNNNARNYARNNDRNNARNNHARNNHARNNHNHNHNHITFRI